MDEAKKVTGAADHELLSKIWPLAYFRFGLRIKNMKPVNVMVLKQTVIY